MRIYTTTKAKIALAVLLLMLVAVFVPTQKTLAAIGGCNSDPAITLSNGQVIHLDSHIGTTVSHVTSVSYSLYGPVGLSVTNYSDPSQLEPVTHFYWEASQSPGFYSAFLTVQIDNSPRASVTFTMTIGSNHYVTSGRTGDFLTVHN